MRIIRIARAASVSLAASLPMIGLGGGCDGSSSNTTAAVKVDPQEATTRQANIENAYKTAPPDAQKKAANK